MRWFLVALVFLLGGCAHTIDVTKGVPVNQVSTLGPKATYDLKVALVRPRNSELKLVGTLPALWLFIPINHDLEYTFNLSGIDELIKNRLLSVFKAVDIVDDGYIREDKYDLVLKIDAFVSINGGSREHSIYVALNNKNSGKSKYSLFYRQGVTFDRYASSPVMFIPYINFITNIFAIPAVSKSIAEDFSEAFPVALEIALTKIVDQIRNDPKLVQISLEKNSDNVYSQLKKTNNLLEMAYDSSGIEHSMEKIKKYSMSAFTDHPDGYTFYGLQFRSGTDFRTTVQTKMYPIVAGTVMSGYANDDFYKFYDNFERTASGAIATYSGLWRDDADGQGIKPSAGEAEASKASPTIGIGSLNAAANGEIESLLLYGYMKERQKDLSVVLADSLSDAPYILSGTIEAKQDGSYYYKSMDLKLLKNGKKVDTVNVKCDGYAENKNLGTITARCYEAIAKYLKEVTL